MIPRLLTSLLCLLALNVYAAEEVAPEEQVPGEIAEPVVDSVLLKEQAIASEVPTKEVTWLSAGDSEVLARYKADETGNPIGGLLFVGAPGDTVVSAPLIRYAFEYFPTVSWHTMAIQPPEFNFEGPRIKQPEQDAAAETQSEDGTASATAEPVMPDEMAWYEEQHEANQELLLSRLVAAEQELNQTGKGYVLIASEFTASILMPLLQQQQLQPIGLVILNLNHPSPTIREQTQSELNELNLPILDIYSIDTRNLGEQRKSLARKANYRMHYMSVGGRNYLGSEPQVSRFIRNWLVKNFKATQ